MSRSGRNRPTQTFEEWEEERRAVDPEWDHRIQHFKRNTGVHRKVPLLLDENLEAEFVEDIRGVQDFKVTVARSGADDATLWAQARRRGAVIVTSDPDFWDDRHYPLRDSPGVVIVAGRSYTEKAETFAVAVVHWDIRWRYRMSPEAMEGFKIRATQSGTQAKWWNGTRVVTMQTERE